MEFLESTWCNRNAQWTTFVFAGHGIESPLKEMTTVSEWKEDVREAIEKRQKTSWMVTVPRLYATEGTPETFFYNTHYFTLQMVVPEEEREEVRFKIFAGFARHYRMIDYLKEWDINKDIPSSHRLKMNRTTWAVESFTREKMEDEFLPKLDLFMSQINTLVWTKLANDIHADLFYADKFKDMIHLLVNGLIRPRQEKATRFSFNLLKAPPSKLVEVLDMTDGNNIVLSTKNDTTESEKEEKIEWREKMPLNNIPPNGFYVPLAVPSHGQYILTIRKYQYTDEGCKKHAELIKRVCYGKEKSLFKPALPIRFNPENYGAYSSAHPSIIDPSPDQQDVLS